MPENTFDIVSKIDLQEVSNAIQQALKEIHTRFDLKDSKSSIELDGKDAIVLHSIDEFKLKSVNDVFQQKLVKRGVPLKGLTYGAIESSLGGAAKQRITMQQAFPSKRPATSLKSSRIRKRKYRRRSRETWCASAAKIATLCRKSLRCCGSRISASTCSSPI